VRGVKFLNAKRHGSQAPAAAQTVQAISGLGLAVWGWTSITSDTPVPNSCHHWIAFAGNVCGLVALLARRCGASHKVSITLATAVFLAVLGTGHEYLLAGMFMYR
jgi:hypothetical protein